MKTKKMLALLALGLVLTGTLAEARGGHRGGRRGGHRGGRGFRHHGGHRRHGGFRRHRGFGYGGFYGPSFGVTVPIGGGGSSRSSQLRYAMKQYNRSGTGASFCNWVNGPYEPGVARSLCNQYNAYISGAGSYSRPGGYVSFGVGGGYGGYGGYGRGWRGRW